LTCPNVSTSPLSLVRPAQGTQTLHPSRSTGDTQTKTSQACIRAMWSPWRPKICPKIIKCRVSATPFPYNLQEHPIGDGDKNDMEEEGQEIRGHSHFEQLRSVLVHACALTDDLRRKHQILENLLVNISQSPATRPLLLDSRRACGLAQHPALCHKNNMTIRKFLLQLASKSREQCKWSSR
jgi:hypothetical protein